jgi:hypothetical protein
VTAGNPFICPRQTPLMGAFADAFTFMFCKSAHAPKMTKAIPIRMDFSFTDSPSDQSAFTIITKSLRRFEKNKGISLSADEKRSTVPVSTSSL